MKDDEKILTGKALLEAVPSEKKSLEVLSDYLSYLSLVSIQRVNSGHPGLPLGCAQAVTVLYRYFLNYATKEEMLKKSAVFRDRFVLSAGHGSALLYALQYVFGNFFSIDDLASFRKLHSHTPGHPEYDLPRGIETTTGPLGQGFSNAVGMAIAGKMLSARFDGASQSQKKEIFNYRVFTLLGDGCMMEGVTQEAASLAGHLKLNNFIALYDCNNISIDGNVDMTMSEDVAKKFLALGYKVAVCNGNDVLALAKSLDELINTSDKSAEEKKPKLLIMHTTIGKGLPEVQATKDAHGAPAGLDQIISFLEQSSLANLDPWQSLLNSGDKKDALKKHIETGAFFAWDDLKDKIKRDDPNFFAKNSSSIYFSKKQNDLDDFLATNAEKKKLYSDMDKWKPSDQLVKELTNYRFSKKKGASRAISGEVLQIVASHAPGLVGGCADLVASTKAYIKDSSYVDENDFSGRNIAYGVREHAMTAIGNGLALSSPFVVFSSTFFSFLDYLKPALRLSALMKLKHLFIFTHDSYAVGEDGPTHQPVEHLNSLRLTPGIDVFRPGDDREVAMSYLYFLKNLLPTALVLSRQSFSELAFSNDIDDFYNHFLKGAYVYRDAERKKMDVVIVASGSELSTALEVQAILQKEQKGVRVVSMPSPNIFMRQEEDYISATLGLSSDAALVYLEAASLGPFRFRERSDKRTLFKSLETFGFSGSHGDLEKYLRYDAVSIAQEINNRFF